MTFRRNSTPGRQAVTWLATAFVLLIGAVATAITLLSVSDRAGWQDWTVWAILFAAIILMLWSLSGTGEKNGAAVLYSWLRVRRRDDPLRLYKPALKRHLSDDRPLGSNAPPTLDSIREAAESSVTWVPRSQPERPSKRER